LVIKCKSTRKDQVISKDTIFCSVIMWMLVLVFHDWFLERGFWVQRRNGLRYDGVEKGLQGALRNRMPSTTAVVASLLTIPGCTFLPRYPLGPVTTHGYGATAVYVSGVEEDGGMRGGSVCSSFLLDEWVWWMQPNVTVGGRRLEVLVLSSGERVSAGDALPYE
jgi:hypothetical protein